MRQVFDAVPERLFVKDRSGRYLRVNRAQAEAMGISAQKFVGLTTEELSRRMGSERTMGNILEEDSRVLATGKRLVLPDMLRVMAGGQRWSRMIKGPLLDAKGRVAGIIGLGIDVTERHAMEESLREANRKLELSERRFRTVLSNAPGVIFQVEVGEDRLPACTFVSEGVGVLTGFGAEEIVRDPGLLRTFLFGSDGTELKQMIRRCETDLSPVSSEFRFRHGGGDIRWIWTRLLPHRAEGGKLVLDGVALDITERKRLEGELHRAERLEAIGQLTSGVAHQFNNLLAIVSGNAELLEQSASGDPQAQTSVAQIQNAVARGSRLVRNLQSFSGLQRLLAASTQINELVNDMHPLIQSTLGDKFTIALELEPGLPPVATDMLRLSSVFLGLVLNAKDAMPGGGEIRVRSRSFALPEEDARQRSVAAGPYVQLEVSDAGIGMSSEVLARSMDPLFSMKHSGDGTGQGLSAAHGLVTQSGGFLTIASREGVGTAVALMFPAQVGELPGSTGEGDRL